MRLDRWGWKRWSVAACVGLTTGCAGLPPLSPEKVVVEDPNADTIDPAVYARAQAERNEFFEREVERLRADLQQAEESIVALESGLRDPRSRADAVSAVAEARIALDRVRENVPWRTHRVNEAETKLAEANRHLEAGNVGAAVFFASRTQRITDTLRAEAKQVALWDERRVIGKARVNLRSGPSPKHHVIEVLPQKTPVFPERRFQKWTLVRTPDGRVGWVHASLLEKG